MKTKLSRLKFHSHFKLTSSSIKIYLATCLLIVFVYLLTENTDISVYELVADPNEVGQVAPYTGLVSTIGTSIFCAIVTVCLFSAYLIDLTSKSAKKWSLFLKFSGYFILLLLIDDLWQIHENFSILLFGAEANISLTNRNLQNFLETIVFGFYGLLFVAYLIRFRKLIYQTDFLFLAFAFGFFLISTIIDIWLKNISGRLILEEGFKLLGIVSLLIYYIRVCCQKILLFADK